MLCALQFIDIGPKDDDVGSETTTKTSYAKTKYNHVRVYRLLFAGMYSKVSLMLRTCEAENASDDAE